MNEHDGVYCSTAGAFFREREQLQEHYQSEFHRYNLKRKVAGLPPVTKEWFEARRKQLSAASAGPLQRIWHDPLSKKKFYSENTYQAFVRSKRYQDMVRKSGQPAPSAIVTIRRLGGSEEEGRRDGGKAAERPERDPAPYTVKPAVRTSTRGEEPKGRDVDGVAEDELEYSEDAASGWETASEEEEEMHGGGDDGGNWEEWDIRCSLFDNHMSSSMEENLEYMWRKYGFYLADGEYLRDPEGLVKYLGAKLQHGHIPLYESGENPNAKQFGSLHAVQRHMIDSGRCKMFYDGNEDEYADFYDYSDDDDEGFEMEVDGSEDDDGRRSHSRALIISDSSEKGDLRGGAAAGFELTVSGGNDGGSVRLLGTREFARYYRQRHKVLDQRDSAAAARVVARYKKLAVPLLGDGTEDSVEQKKAQRQARRAQRQRLAVSIRRNVNDNLPRNVPY